MSDETDVEQLLDNFQKALDTLNNIGNVEALITKLDANKNRKLLKKVKHVVSEVHSKVGTVKDKVSKAYKRVKIRSSSESEDVFVTGNTDRDVSEREDDSLEHSEDALNTVNDKDRYSPIVGGKRTVLKRSTRKNESQKNRKEGNGSSQNSDDVSDKQSKENAGKEHDKIDDHDPSVENNDEREIHYSETDVIGNIENQDNAEDQTGRTIDNEENEKGDGTESSEEVIEGTPESSVKKITLSLNKTRNKRQYDSSSRVLNNVDSGMKGNRNSQNQDEEKERNKYKESSKPDQQEEEVDENDGSNSNSEAPEDSEKDESGKTKNISDNEAEEMDTSNSPPPHISDDDEGNGVKNAHKKSSNKKNRDNDASDNEEDTLKGTPKKSDNKKNKPNEHGEKNQNVSDSDETPDLEVASNKSDNESESDGNRTDKLSEDDGDNDKEKNKEKNSKDSDEENIVTIEDTPKKGSENNKDGNEGNDLPEAEPKLIEDDIKTKDQGDEARLLVPKIKLVDISKLLAPNTIPLDIMTPSPKTKKSVTFDSSVIILSSSDEETPKKDPKSKDQSPLKSAMRKSASKEADNSESDSKENNENLENRRATRQTRTQSKKVLTSDNSSDDSDFEDNRRSRRLRKNEATLKDKFSQLASRYSERKCKAAAVKKLRENEHSSEKEDWRENRKKRNKDKKLASDSDKDDSDSNKRNKKRRRKKDLLEISSLSEASDHSDMSDFEEKSRQKSKPKLKKARIVCAEPDKNDPKFKENVSIRLPLFKCEELPEIYKRKKDIFEVKKLTKMDFTRRTRSARNGSSKNSDDSDKPDKKRIKLTLKLKKKDKPKEDSSDDERSSTEENKEDEVKKKNGGKKDKDGTLEVDPFDVSDDAVANEDLAEACLEQIKDNSDKEESDKQSEESKSEDEEGTKKSKKKKKGNKDKKSDEESTEETEKESAKNEKDKKLKVNGVLSDDEEQSDKDEKDREKDQEDNDSTDEDGGKKKKGKKWKNDTLLTQKIDSSDSDEDFAKFSRKKDKSNAELVRQAKKRMKKSTVISDSESDEGRDKEKKKKGKDSDGDEDYKGEDKSSSESGSNSEKEEESEKEEKKPRKRIKRVKDSSSDDDDKSTRKNLRRMIDRDSLSETTKKAAHDEKERKSRIAEKQKKYNLIFDLKADATVDKVVLDFDEKSDKELLTVGKKLARQLKPHQVLGVKFMWDACFESLERLKKHRGSGCILAHCMGLGKTLQVITLIHALLTNSDRTKVEKIMVVCPVNTVLNWKSEFKKWLPKGDEVEVYELVSCKTSSVNHERNYIVKEWHENGGVLIIGYNMFRTLSNPDNKTISKKLRESFVEGLVDPGPDLVVCDEGHLLKNEKTHLSIAMNKIKTQRRIVLTGTPLQNNLKEYWCMVQFIKPNLLGTYKEYMNRFVNPITNGQYTDSTQHDIVIMRRRSHVLHKLLDGVVQRQDYSVLEPYLPPKYEYVLFLSLTQVQVKLFQHYMDNFARQGDGSNRTSFLFKDFQQLQRICTHPRVLLDKSIEDKDKKEPNDESESEGSLKDFIDDESEAQSTSSSEGSGSGSDSEVSIKSDENKKKKKKKGAKRTRVTRAQAAQKRKDGDSSESEVEVLERKEWWQEYIDKEELDNINHSAKIFLLFEILKECEEIGDKILVFSQSLYTLNCLEYFLQRIDEATQKGETEKVGGHSGSWAIGLDYFRLDGSSSCDNRASWCDQFNDPDNTRARLFLISTKAGGLGINLVAANRVIIFDVSWNPSHDIQSIYRVYRFGQTKPSYIYRFVTYGTMEMKIYERQVTKQAISKRVIDEQQIDRHYSQNDIQELYKTDLEPADRPIPLVPKDVLLGELLQKHDKTIFKYHEHQSLLENKQDEQLNEEERKAAWDEFENEKVVRKTSITNFGGMNLAAFQNSMNFSPQLIQVALANIVRKDNPAWSEVQIRGILPALVAQLQMQMSENDFNMYNRVQQEIRLMQSLQAQRMRENYFKQYQLQQLLQKQQFSNQVLGNLNITPEELRRIQASATQNYIHPSPPTGAAGGSGDVIELND